MKAIVAVDRLWGIGNNGHLLFHIKEDMEFFKSNTINKVVVMGRKTLDALPDGKPLKDRTNLVITSNKSYQNHDNIIFGDINEINKEIKKYDTNDIFIIGGETIYRQFINRCDTVYVTRNNEVYNADVYMPNLAFEGFVPKQIMNKGFSDSNGYWRIEEWITSECDPYNAVMWLKYSHNYILFMYSNDLNNWVYVYTNQSANINNEIKELISPMVSSRDKLITITKINNSYYRADINATKDNNELSLAAFGNTESEANQNLMRIIVNIIA